MAASRAVKRYGKVVAKVRMATNATVQDAVRVVDLLYRGGCSAVRIRFPTNLASPKVDVYPVVWILRGEDQEALGGSSPLRPPPVAPRTLPWTVDGANEPGSARLTLQPMPDRRGRTAPGDALPNYAAQGRVPAAAFERAEATVRNWAQGLSADLLAAARGRPQLVPHLVTSLRGPESVAAAQGPVRRFARAHGMDVATLVVSAYLYQANQGVGIVDLLLFFSPTRLEIVSARWRGRTPSGAPGPLVADPYAGGTSGRLRVWVEAMLLHAQRKGPQGLPMAPLQRVLSALPASAHAGLTQAVADQAEQLQGLIRQLEARRFDRVVLRAERLAVGASLTPGDVRGVLYATVQPEAGELRLRDLASP